MGLVAAAAEGPDNGFLTHNNIIVHELSLFYSCDLMFEGQVANVSFARVMAKSCKL